MLMSSERLGAAEQYVLGSDLRKIFLTKSPVEIFQLTKSLGNSTFALDHLSHLYLHYWLHGATLDAAGMSSTASSLVAERQSDAGGKEATPFEKHKDQILSYLKSCFVPRENAFWVTPDKRAVSIYATFHAINVLKALSGIRHNEKLSFNRAEDLLKEVNEELSVRSIRGFLERCVSLSEEFILDIPNVDFPSIPAFVIMTSILWNLEKEDWIHEFSKILPKRKAFTFLLNSFKIIENPTFTVGGFSSKPDVSHPSTSITYFALKALDRLGWLKDFLGVLDKDLKQRYQLEKRNELMNGRELITRYAYSCWQGNGFSATIGGAPNVANTMFCLRILLEHLPGADVSKHKKFVKGNLESLVAFVRSCYSKDGGVSYAPGLMRGSLGPRYALGIEKTLIKQDIYTKPIFSLSEVKAITNFIEGKLLSRNPRCVSGYPASELALNKEAYGSFSREVILPGLQYLQDQLKPVLVDSLRSILRPKASSHIAKKKTIMDEVVKEPFEIEYSEEVEREVSENRDLRIGLDRITDEIRERLERTERKYSILVEKWKDLEVEGWAGYSIKVCVSYDEYEKRRFLQHDLDIGFATAYKELSEHQQALLKDTFIELYRLGESAE